MHSLDSVNLNVTSLNILDRLIVNVFSKIFKTFDKKSSIIACYTWIVGLLSMNIITDERSF